MGEITLEALKGALALIVAEYEAGDEDDDRRYAEAEAAYLARFPRGAHFLYVVGDNVSHREARRVLAALADCE